MSYHIWDGENQGSLEYYHNKGDKMETQHYKILQSSSLITEEQLEELFSDGWILLQIVPDRGKFYFYFYRN